MRREPRFEKDSDRKREKETLEILVKDKELTFNMLEKFAPVDAEIIDIKTKKILSLCEIKSYYKYLKDINLYAIHLYLNYSHRFQYFLYSMFYLPFE